MRQRISQPRSLRTEILESRRLLSATPHFSITTIGDSISSGLSPADADRLGVEPRAGYRAPLWNMAQDQFAASADIDFVGASTYNPTELPEDGMQHSTYRGFTTYSFFPFDSNPNIGSDPEGIPNENTLNADGWATFDVDAALVLLGINDVFEGRLIESIEDGLRDIINELRNDNAGINILLGTLTPVDETRANFDMVPAVNEMIFGMTEPDELDGWVGSTANSPIHIVDHYNGQGDQPAFDLETHSVDGAHPNDAGDQLLANNWWSVLEPIIADAIAVDDPPTEEPPTEEPPAGEPPAEEPPTEEPPTEEPPTEEPPAGEPPAGEPPPEEPPAEDPPPENPNVQFTIEAMVDSVVEGATANFLVTRTGDLAEAATVELTVSGTAAAGSDFEPLPSTLEIPAGESSAVIELLTIDDDAIENQETVTIALSQESLQTDPAEATIVIRNNDTPAPLAPRVGVTASKSSVGEGGKAAFIFTRKAFDTSQPLVIEVSVGGTAKSNADYKASTRQVVIPAGQSQVEVVIDVKDDGQREADETIVVNIVKAGRYTIAEATALLTIVDNDARPITPVAAGLAEAAAGIASDRAKALRFRQ